MMTHDTVSIDVDELTRNLRTQLREGKSNIPPELKLMKIWLVWKTTEINGSTGKFNKIPLYPRSLRNRYGEQGNDFDRANLGTWDDAMGALKSDLSLAGVGIAMLPGNRLVALDADKCIIEDKIREDVYSLIDDTYCEISPSGTGIRAFWSGETANGKNHNGGFELFHSTGFVTITGNRVDNFHQCLGDVDLPQLSADMRNTLEKLATPVGGKDASIKQSDRLGQVAKDDPILNAIKEAGIYERNMGGGKHSIECPFEHEHSDHGRASGDGDTVYFLPNTNGYAQGHFQCMHSHCAGKTDADFLDAINYNSSAAAIAKLMADFGPADEKGWPDPLPFSDDLLPVPALDLMLLPDSLRPWISDIAERMQIPPDIPAIGAVTALSAAIGRRVQIRPKAQDNWTVVPNLWGMVVAPPGYMKSPALNSVMTPLYKMEREANQEYHLEIEQYEMDKKRVENSNKAMLARLKKSPNAEIGEALVEPEKPIARRYIVNNFSLEALGEVLIGNPDGVLAFNDELYGLIKMADKSGNEELQTFLLSAWNGDGSFNFDRIGRGQRFLEYVCVAALGGIQPDRLVDYLADTSRSGAIDSGFIQRFQLLTWPDLSEKWELVDRSPDKEAEEIALQIFKRAAGQHPSRDFGDWTADNTPDVRQFDSEAQATFYDWLESHEHLVRGKALPSVMASHLGKFRSLVPSLALIFAVADNKPGPIPMKYVQQAIGWANYLRSHAERMYLRTTQPSARHARALLNKIREGAILDNFTARSVYSKNWSLLNRDGVTKAIDLLCDMGYLLRFDEKYTAIAGGRPSITYRINPKAKSDLNSR